MPTMTKDTVQNVILASARRLERRATELSELDAKMGDGDTGSTLASIAQALHGEVESLPEDLGDCYGTIVRTIGKTSGSSLSAVIMTGFQRLAVETKGRATIPWSELGDLLGLAAQSMQESGRANPGDKCIVDGLLAIAMAISQESDPMIIAALADGAVSRTLDEFRGRPSKIGRARLAPRQGIGQDDPGMVALKRIIEAIRSGDDTLAVNFRRQVNMGNASS